MQESPYAQIGGRAEVLALSEAFYDHMQVHELALAATHPLTPEGLISPMTRERFGLFLVGWLGGPTDYMDQYGHPRLRMRHRHVAIDTPMAEAWVRCMDAAMTSRAIDGPVRSFLDERFAHVAAFLRNTPDDAGSP